MENVTQLLFIRKWIRSTKYSITIHISLVDTYIRCQIPQNVRKKLEDTGMYHTEHHVKFSKHLYRIL